MKYIQQVCEELGVSRTTVYKYIKKLNIAIKKDGNVALIADADFEKLREALNVNSVNQVHTDYKQEYIQALQQQIADLKEQLKAKDEQIAKLIQTNQNFQVLLKEKDEKIQQIEAPKSFFKKLFSRRQE